MSRVGPLLKWAGGKRQLLPCLRRFYPQRFGRYIEPFFGSGAVFFDLHAAGRLERHEVVLIDSNADLVGCYEMVRDSPAAVGDELERLSRGHRASGLTHYYEVRDKAFNPMREARRDREGRIAYTPELAAMFIYLNRTGYNGLFRLNSRGRFNVPAGRYERPKIVDRPKLLAVAGALGRSGVGLQWASFELGSTMAKRGDFVYCDPPYAPLSATSNFTSYTSLRFGDAEQRRLQAMVVTLARRGCHVLVSNSAADTIRELYDEDPAVAAAGLRTMRVPARRAINSKGASRGPICEYLVTNVPEGA
jgi:DNA adenine methylase